MTLLPRYRWLLFVVAGPCLLPLAVTTGNTTLRVIFAIGVAANLGAAVLSRFEGRDVRDQQKRDW